MNIGIIAKNTITKNKIRSRYIIIIPSQSQIFILFSEFRNGANKTFKNNAKNKITKILDTLYIKNRIQRKRAVMISFFIYDEHSCDIRQFFLKSIVI
jgi:hypothetical protein